MVSTYWCSGGVCNAITKMSNSKMKWVSHWEKKDHEMGFYAG